MNTNLALLLLLAPFLDFLFNIFFGKVLEKPLLEFLGLLWLLFRLVLHYTFFGQISAKTPIQIQLFDWIQINNFNVDFGFLLDQLSILWLLFYRNRFFDSFILDQLYA
jgi:NADH-quinone oxidoreductase subunit L